MGPWPTAPLVRPGLYCKKSFTGFHTNFDSLSPIQYLINLISVLVYRGHNICSSSYLSFHEQACSIKRFLQQKQVPIYLVNRIIRNSLERQYIAINTLQNVPKLPVLFLLPYLGARSLRLKKKLNKFLRKMLGHQLCHLFLNYVIGIALFMFVHSCFCSQAQFRLLSSGLC